MDKVVVGIHEAKMQFSKLVKQAQAWQEIVVTRFGRPVVKIVRYVEPSTKRKPGLLAGRVTIKPGFDDVPTGFSNAVDR